MVNVALVGIGCRSCGGIEDGPSFCTASADGDGGAEYAGGRTSGVGERRS